MPAAYLDPRGVGKGREDAGVMGLGKRWYEPKEMKGAMAQKSRDEAKKEVLAWLKKMGYVK